MEPKYYTDGRRTRKVESPELEVRLRYDGWEEVEQDEATPESVEMPPRPRPAHAKK